MGTRKQGREARQTRGRGEAAASRAAHAANAGLRERTSHARGRCPRESIRLRHTDLGDRVAPASRALPARLSPRRLRATSEPIAGTPHAQCAKCFAIRSLVRSTEFALIEPPGIACGQFTGIPLTP